MKKYLVLFIAMIALGCSKDEMNDLPEPDATEMEVCANGRSMCPKTTRRQ